MELISPIPRRERRVSSTRIGLLMTGVILAFIALLSGRSIEWFIVKQSLRHRFPRVDWITTERLADWLADKKRQPPVLLDVRTEEEWNVSRVPGARRVDPNASIEKVISGLPQETPIVTYCAVGYRSGELATKLRAAGFTNVWNLEGSIFQWANERRPLVREDEAVTTVHPYSSSWGRLLTDDVRARLKK